MLRSKEAEISRLTEALRANQGLQLDGAKKVAKSVIVVTFNVWLLSFTLGTPYIEVTTPAKMEAWSRHAIREGRICTVSDGPAKGVRWGRKHHLDNQCE